MGKSNIYAIFCSLADQFDSNLVGNPEDRVSHG